MNPFLTANVDILYAFADTDASSGAIKLTDSYADQEVSKEFSFISFMYSSECRNTSQVIHGASRETTFMVA